MNSKIIDELNKLTNMIKVETDELRKKKDNKAVIRNSFRIRYLNNLINIVKNLDFKITKKNYMDLKNFDGVGKGSLNRIKEILEKDTLEETKNFKFDNKKKQSVEELMNIIGIGRSNAVELYNQGATTIKKLRKMIEKNKIEVNDKIKLGLKYHGVFEENIPRKEIDKVYKMFSKITKKINKEEGFDEKNKYCFEICGSYRRMKSKSGDIDILLTKFGTKDKISDESSSKHLTRFVDFLKEPVKYNNNNKFLIDDMTDKNITTKYMGFGKYKDNPVRRIDIRFIPYESYHSALLYFTGSCDLNKKMRKIAKSKNLKLSEYGLFKENGKKIKTKSEEDIFKKLGLDYVEPKFR
jgi:DNA polymerase beta